jgi:hypothetical protein
LHIQTVFLELGLLSVKKVCADEVLLGSPNWMVTQNAMRVLVHETRHERHRHEATPSPDLANEYLSAQGFGQMVSKAATTVTNLFRPTERDVIREYPFQDYLFMQLLYRFPNGDNTVRQSSYRLYKEVNTAAQLKKIVLWTFCTQSLLHFLARLPSPKNQAQQKNV